MDAALSAEGLRAEDPSEGCMCPPDLPVTPRGAIIFVVVFTGLPFCRFPSFPVVS